MSILEDQQQQQSSQCITSNNSNNNNALAEAFAYSMRMLPQGDDDTSSSKRSVMEFMGAVVSEVEDKYTNNNNNNNNNDDDDGAFENNYQFLIDDLDLERKIRTKDPEIVQLVCDVRAFAECEWLEWEQQVMESLSDVIVDTNNNTNNNSIQILRDNAMDSGEHLVRGIQDTIALIESKASRRARRTSLKRRNDAMKQLSSEVEGLERRVAALEFEHTGAMVDVSKLNVRAVQMDGLIVDRAHLERCRASAEEERRAYGMLEGLLSFAPLCLEGGRVHVMLHRNYMGRHCRQVESDGEEQNNNNGKKRRQQQNAIDVRFDIGAKSGYVTVDASAAAVPCDGMTISWGLQTFVEESTKDVCRALNGRVLDDPCEIMSALQVSQWRVGRMELIARELHALQLKYETILEPQEQQGGGPMMMTCISDDDDYDGLSPSRGGADCSTGKGRRRHSSGFALTIDFTSRTRAAKLRVCFDIRDSYPFSPMDVCMDAMIGHDCVDVDALGRQLMKNATPGFAYLSRACDVIVAYLQ